MAQTFSGNIRKILHILIPSGKHVHYVSRDSLKLGIVHVHQTMTAQHSEQLVIEVS